MEFFKRTPEYDKLIKQYYPEDEVNTPESLHIYEVIVITSKGKESGGLFTYTYVDGKEVGIKLESKDGDLIGDVGVALRDAKDNKMVIL